LYFRRLLHGVDVSQLPRASNVMEQLRFRIAGTPERS
jgi:hypothetical protein